MKLRHFEVFRAVMRTGSVTEAARLLGVTQPAVSKGLREAESELGLRLFDRLGGRVEARPEARTLHAAVDKVFLEVERVRLLAEELHDPLEHRVRVGAIPIATMTVVPRATARFRRLHPDVKVEISALTTRDIVDGVAAGDLEIGLAYLVREHPSVELIDLPETEIVCAMPAHHPLASQEAVSPLDLRRHPFISFALDEPIGLTINEAFRDCGVKCAPAVIVSHSFAACALVAEGEGVALVTSLATTGAPFHGLVVRPFRPTVRLRPRILLSRHHTRPAQAAALVREIRSAVGGAALQGG